MDGVELNNDPFALKMVDDPVIMSNVGETVAFSTEFPCKKDLIEIEVKWIEIHIQSLLAV